MDQWSTGGGGNGWAAFTNNTGPKTLGEIRFLLQYPRLKVTEKIRVKSSSARDLPGLPSAVSGCWPFTQGLAVWFIV